MLLDKSAVNYPQIADHKDKVMAAIKDWYGGYRIGKCSEKYNPRSVCAFIEFFCSQLKGSKKKAALSVPDALQSAAKVYLIDAGKPGLIETLIDKHRDQAADTIEQLIGEYKNRASDDASPKPASQSNHAVSLQLPKPDVRRIVASDECSTEEILALCLSAGYLIQNEPGSVCIPNREMYTVWCTISKNADK
ncbi:hypothetical protein H4S06_006743 [Coemansia sp. BCRC 34490]|nr:hypothetical protein H4S06_006743 [Coemansia sp. BCRC 34490]